MRKNNCRENGVKWFLILFLGVFIMLSGCAQAEQETSPEKIGSFGVDGYYYEACELAVEGLADNCLFKPVICGEKIYYAKDSRTDNTQANEYTIFCYDTARQTYQEIPVADPDFYWLRMMEADGEGNLYLVLELLFNAGSFIEEASAECNFLSPEFMEILEFAASYPETGIAPEDENELKAHLRDGEILLMDVSFSDITGYAYSCLLFSGEPVTCIGYPSPENTVGCLISPNNEVYGILSSSKHPEGAWEFIEAWLAGSLKDESDLSGFPSDTSKLDLMLRKGLDEEYMEKRGMRAISEEELAALYELIGRAQPWHSWDQAVLQIIVEEAAEYFAGNITQQEAAEHIQSRVELYLKEKE